MLKGEDQSLFILCIHVEIFMIVVDNKWKGR